MTNFIKELEWRGLIHQMSSPKLAEQENLVLFAGFDPTADSLHVGHLLPLITLQRAALAGHHPMALIGGATGMIGDPSGKSAERSLLHSADVHGNSCKIIIQILKLVPGLRIVNNFDWFKTINFISFLRDVGKNFSVNAMLTRDAVKNRLEAESGISFTEFSYILMQAFDFLHLFQTTDCRLQIGGSDQWGNIASGIDLIRRFNADIGHDREAFGLTMPLITNSNGEKFGKTVKGAVWLDAEKTSVHDMFQFFFNTADEDVIKFLKFFTFLDQNAINELEDAVKTIPEHRQAQRVLANEICRFVHGVDGDKPPIVTIVHETTIVHALIMSGLCSSKLDARRNLQQNAVKLNGEIINDINHLIRKDDFANKNELLLTKGKKARCLLALTTRG